MKKKEEQKENEEGIVEEVVDEILPGMGGLVKRLKKRSPELERKIEETDKEIKDRLRKGYSRRPKVECGFSIRTLVREEEKRRNVEKEKEGEISEPIVDVFDEKDHIKVIAELPGINENDINVELEGRKIILDARSKERRYHKTIELPHAVKDKAMKKRYKNGILDLEMLKNGT